MTMIKYSVVVPNKNHGHHIRQCLESIANQGYEDYEVIIYDNGSTDNSLEIIKEFLNDPRFSLHVSTEGFPSPAPNINKAINMATGEVALWLNSDDYLLENYFKTTAMYFKNPKVGFVSIGVEAIHPDKPKVFYKPAKIQKENLGEIVLINKIYPSSPFRRQLFLDIGGLDPNMIFFDWDFWVRCLIDGVAFRGWEYRICDCYLAARRIHPPKIGKSELTDGHDFKTVADWYVFAGDQIVHKYVRAELPHDSIIQK